ncbi:MAG TPA: methyltransferase domain-containing protein [Acidimicrobiales bacterium]|nr:methyltransferase domain-containing protein [Acidimicrobiales bacterium]
MAVETVAFGPLTVTFDERVLRPRAWTLGQAAWAAQLAAGMPEGPILELCSGAGHIGQAAAALSGRHVVQVDLDPHACELAAANASANGLGEQVRVECADLATWTGDGTRFPLVLADPPYLPRHEVPAWPDDPELAIDGGGPAGLELPRRCLAAAARHLAPGGAVLLQALGAEQVEALAADLVAAGLAVVEVRAEDARRAVALLRRRA